MNLEELIEKVKVAFPDQPLRDIEVKLSLYWDKPVKADFEVWDGKRVVILYHE